jgi:anti-sigma-K factor RskA
MWSHSLWRSAIAAIALAVAAANVALAGGSVARPAIRSERSAILAALEANDGSSAGVRGVYVSRSDSSLAVVCVRTPDAGLRAFVFHHTAHAWRYLTSGSPGAAGSSTDRHLERACH